MARSTIWPGAQADGDLDTGQGWSFPFFPTQDRMQEIGGWMSSDNAATHSAAISHGITTTGDWQISFTVDSASGEPVGALIVDGSLNGYYVYLDANLVVVQINGGSLGAGIISAARVAGGHVATFIEVSYTASSNTFAAYENGASRGTGSNSTYEATAKSTMYVLATQSGGSACRLKDTFIQDYISIAGAPPTADVSATPAAVVATTTIPTPTVTRTATAAPAAVACTTTIPAATVTRTGRATPAAVVATTTIPTATVTRTAVAAVTAVTATTTIPAPTVGIVDAHSVRRRRHHDHPRPDGEQRHQRHAQPHRRARDAGGEIEEQPQRQEQQQGLRRDQRHRRAPGETSPCEEREANGVMTRPPSGGGRR